MYGTTLDITDRKKAEQALLESEEKFRTLADLVPQMVWMCTTDGLNVYFNRRWVDYTGMSLEESYGRGWNTPFHDDDKQKAWDAWNRAVATGGDYEVESRLRAADGSYRWFLMQGTPLRDHSGDIVKWFGTCTDIESMKKAEEVLRRSEQEFRTMANAMPQLSWMANPDGWIYWYNQRWYQYTGKTPQQMEGWGWQSVHDPVQLPTVMERWRASILTGELFEMTFPLLGADGKFRTFLTRVSPLKDESGKVLRWFGTNTDIEEQKVIENKLRELSGELLHLQDEERRRIARELHDTTAQDLAALCINLSMLNQSKEMLGVKERDALAQCRKIADESLSSLRTVSYLLHPPLLDESGLESALQWFVEGFTKRSGISVTLELDRTVGRLPQEAELAIFRIVQESLGNIHRHSKSAIAKVSLRKNGAVTLQVEDEGVGLPHGGESTVDAVARLGVGIAGMTERVRQLGGELIITPRKPKGTIVRAVIPLEAKRSEAADSNR